MKLPWMKRGTGVLAATLAILAAAGCGNDSTSPTAPDCDKDLTFTLNGGAAVAYEVTATAGATLYSVTYTDVTGDVTLTSPSAPVTKSATLPKGVHGRLAVVGRAGSGQIHGTLSAEPSDDLIADQGLTELTCP